jgi:hypothetical protein
MVFLKNVVTCCARRPEQGGDTNAKWSAPGYMWSTHPGGARHSAANACSDSSLEGLTEFAR